ncbi:MAG: QacE family quaternary ammonium compound efflux SMR transporter [Bacteroidetes bacterium 43-93]|nr:multidrug efflux SMR transporter [Bacteroidota bacterium]OJW98966.1 MAG: QacE family quaternary ammonium compound efflux SMR transporter [Bacteroidetes bacterium 43-93]
MKYVYLLIAIVSEVIATSSLKASEGLTKLWPSVLVIAGYGSALYFLSITVKVMPVGISYALWSGIGIVLVTIAGIFLYKQVPDTPAIIGMLLILIGVLVINIFSKTKGLE